MVRPFERCHSTQSRWACGPLALSSCSLLARAAEAPSMPSIAAAESAIRVFLLFMEISCCCDASLRACPDQIVGAAGLIMAGSRNGLFSGSEQSGAWMIAVNPDRIVAEMLRQHVDEGPDFGRDMVAMRINCVDRVLAAQVVAHDRHKAAGLDVLGHDEARSQQQALAMQRRRAERDRAVAAHIARDCDARLAVGAAQRPFVAPRRLRINEAVVL